MSQCRSNARRRLVILLTLSIVTVVGSAEPDAVAWNELEPGLELASIPLPTAPAHVRGSLVVLRIDPARYELTLLSCDAQERGNNRSVRRWCEAEGLVAAINAGMYATDRRTHVGYLRSDDHVNSSHINQYRSVAAFGARWADDPAFRIFDLDQPDVSMESINSRYVDVVQNLRLIKRPGENRWSQQERRWSEAALGEDAQGRVLFIFCEQAYTMHDLNEILLDLPLDLVCAQHLEGGAAAQMFVGAGDLQQEWIGTHQSGNPDRNPLKWAISVPCVIGVRPLDLP